MITNQELENVMNKVRQGKSVLKAVKEIGISFPIPRIYRLLINKYGTEVETLIKNNKPTAEERIERNILNIEKRLANIARNKPEILPFLAGVVADLLFKVNSWQNNPSTIPIPKE